MSKGNTFENEWLEHIFNNAALPLIGDASGLQPSAADGDLYVSLHTSDPGEAGGQNTNEISYTGYARVAVPRDGSGFTVTGASVSPQADITFPQMTAGAGGTVTHWAIGTASAGAGKLLYSGLVTPNIVVGAGVTPELTTATAITED